MADGRLRGLVRDWWGGRLGAAGVILDAAGLPAELLFRGVVAARGAAYDGRFRGIVRAGVPVVSVGNLAVGGTGKTPFAHFVARALAERGMRPAILHGGYGLDEPALHRRWSPDLPVVIGRDRATAARGAVEGGADVLVLDDGFQHRRLARDLDLVLLAAERGIDRVRLLPRGPWREPLRALRRASAVVVTRRTAGIERAADVAGRLRRYFTGPVIVVHLAPGRWLRNGLPSDPPAGPAVAVAALAEPEVFAASARHAGADVARLLPFPDHHEYDPRDAARILAAAGEGGIVTSEKDWVKLERLVPGDRVHVLAQEVRLEAGAETLAGLLNTVCGLGRRSGEATS